MPSYVSTLLLITSLFLPACEFAETSNTCPAGLGVQSQAYTGAALASKQLVLTIDGGPSATTAAMDSQLFAKGIQAAFFVNGHSVTGQEATLTTLKAHGHLVGNRSYSGKPLTETKDVEREVRRTDALLIPYVTGNMFLLRSSGTANLSTDVAQQFNNAGLSRYVGPIGWDIGGADSGVVSDSDCWNAGTAVSDCASSYLNAITKKDHGIVLLHSDDSRSSDLVQTLLPQLQTLQFKFLRLDAVPAISAALTSANAQVGAVAGAPGCSEY